MAGHLNSCLTWFIPLQCTVVFTWKYIGIVSLSRDKYFAFVFKLWKWRTRSKNCFSFWIRVSLLSSTFSLVSWITSDRIKVFHWFCLKNLKLTLSILLHSGLNPAWHFWLSTRFSCCLKIKSVENILGYIREAVSLKKIFEIVQGNTTKFLGNK